MPEAECAIIAMGKRDTAFDAGLPLPVLYFRPGDRAPSATPAHQEVIDMMNQYAHLKITPGDDTRVDDMITFDISYPCLTFDKWCQTSVIDDVYSVADIVQVYF